MTVGFVATASGKDSVAVYEFDGQTLSLLNNRAFHLIVPDEQAAEMEVRKHALLFFSGAVARIDRMQLSIGTYHRSIARPIFGERSLVNLEFEKERELIARAKREIAFLSHDLEECFDVSSPHQQNLGVFGTRYESTILFACIGIENLFLKALKDNGVKPKGSMYNSTDFVKLNAHLRLSEYQAKLGRYPWLPPFAPFAHWNIAQPTQSLVWFHAYNKLKHDKAVSYAHATMENAINACLAYWIVLRAVFGNAVDGRAFFQKEDDDFYLTSVPKWDLDQHYFAASDGKWISMVVNI
jgi:hypothetical protein